MTPTQSLAKEVAQQAGLDPVLVCAVVEQESGWDSYAIRFEPAFLERYVDPLRLSATEAHARSFSWGLMQVMGEVAREEGYKGPLPALCDPRTGLIAGCAHLKTKLKEANGDVHKALLLWNGGADASYPSQVLARQSHYE